jgi:K+-sensing histidine kinase KdpD
MSTARDTLWLERLAHDLRGPLSPIKSAVFLLRRPDVGAVERSELLDMVDRQSDRLLDMVAELSAWVRCQQGGIVKRRDRIELALAIEGCIAALPPAWRARVHFEPAVEDACVDGDVLRLGDVLRTMLLVGEPPAAGDEVLLTVRADGPAHVLIERTAATDSLSVDRVALLFDSVDPAPPDEGLGLRPLIAKAIATELGGKLAATVIAPDQARLSLRLPRSAPIAG